MVYPWPFAAMSSQGIWWEDLLQTTSVKYEGHNKLSELFDIPPGDSLKEPVFFFGKRGQSLDNPSVSWARLSTGKREVFDNWVWDQLQVKVEIANQHDHTVGIYWLNGKKAKTAPVILEPGQSYFMTTMLSHEFWVLDMRLDTRADSPRKKIVTNNSKLISWKITSDEPRQRLIIPLTKCLDLSGHCLAWAQQGECTRNPGFMHVDCRKSCNTCAEDEQEKRNETSGNQEIHDKQDKKEDPGHNEL